MCSHSSSDFSHPPQSSILLQVIYIGGAVMSLFLDGEPALPALRAALSRRLLRASPVLKGDKRGAQSEASPPLSGCWRGLLIGKMQIFFDQEKD